VSNKAGCGRWWTRKGKGLEEKEKKKKKKRGVRETKSKVEKKRGGRERRRGMEGSDTHEDVGGGHRTMGTGVQGSVTRQQGV
jgi:hypothetical protein